MSIAYSELISWSALLNGKQQFNTGNIYYNGESPCKSGSSCIRNNNNTVVKITVKTTFYLNFWGHGNVTTFIFGDMETLL